MTKIYEKFESADLAYKRGDFKEARRLAKEVLETRDLADQLEDRARRILRGTGIDPMAVAVFLLTGAILASLFVYYVL